MITIIAPTAMATASTVVPEISEAEVTSAYFTVEDLEARVGGEVNFVRLTDDDKDGIPDSGVVAQILASVDNEANAYFRAGAYDIPLSVIQIAPVRNALLDIANYRAKVRGDREASLGDRQLYEDAIGLLMAVAKRQILLDSPESQSQLGDYLFESEEPVFSRSSLRVM